MTGLREVFWEGFQIPFTMRWVSERGEFMVSPWAGPGAITAPSKAQILQLLPVRTVSSGSLNK